MSKNLFTVITDEEVKEKLYERFIQPTKNGKKDYIGVEIELPIVNLEKRAVDFEVVHNVTKLFQDTFITFHHQSVDEKGNICSLVDKDNGDIISYDCSYNNLEFSFGKEVNLFSIYDRFVKYYTFFKDNFEKYNHTLTGFGVNPYRKYNYHVPIPNGRYKMLYHHLSSYPRYSRLPMFFHDYPEYGMFSSASQVQLDVEYDEIVRTINVFSKLEPLKALLFSNSILLDENESLLCCRDMFWQDSTHGINPHNIGMYEIELTSIEDLIEYLASLNIYCTMRGKKYINFPTINILDYFRQDTIEGEYSNHDEYEDIKIEPELNDIEYLRSFKFLDLTYRGTIEYRSCCTQPVSDCLTVAAFQLGLKHNLDELEKLLDNDTVIYHKGYSPSELRKLFVKRELPHFVNEDKLYELLEKVLNISYEGLVKRNNGEEEFLDPLYERVAERTNPAKRMLHLLDNGFELEDIIKEYGSLNY